MLGIKYGRFMIAQNYSRAFCETEWPRPRHKAESRASAVTETVGFRNNKAIEHIE